MTVQLVVIIKMKEDLRAKYEHLARESQKEDGCLKYTLSSVVDEPNTLVIQEEWQSQEALDRHTKTPHYLAMGEFANKTETELRVITPIV